MVKNVLKKQIKIPEGAKTLLFQAFIFSLAFISSSVPFAFGVYPFGLSICAASKKEAPLAFIGAFLGTVLFLDLNPVYLIAYVSLFVLRLTLSFLKKPKEQPMLGKRRSYFNELFLESEALRVLSSFAVSLGVGLYFVISEEFSAYDISGLLFISSFVPVLTFSLVGLFEKTSSRSFLISIGAVLFILAYCLSGREILGIDFFMVFSFMLVLYVSKYSSSLYALLIGILLGLPSGGTLAPILGILALVSGLLFKVSYLLSVFASFIISMGYAIYVGGYDAIINFVPEALFAAITVYPLLRFDMIKPPECLLNNAAKETSSEAISFEYREKKYQREKELFHKTLLNISELFYESAKSVRTKNKEAVEKSCKDALMEFCASCPKREICYKKDYPLTKSTVKSLCEGVFYLGAAKKKSLDEQFIHRCPNVDEVIDKINKDYLNEQKNEIKNDRLELGGACFGLTSRMLFASSTENDDISNELTKVATKTLLSLGIIFDKACVFGTERHRALITKIDTSRTEATEKIIRSALEKALGFPLSEGEITYCEDGATIEIAELPPHKISAFSHTEGSKSEANGDSVVTFKGLYNKEYFIICDGMGSGHEAKLTSSLSSGFLEKTLSCSLDKESALSLLNSFVRAKGHECSTSVDLLEIDPFSSEAVFYKSGAAPSYVLRSGTVFKLLSKTAPIGIMKKVDSEQTRFNLLPNDICIMISDGVLDKKSDDKELLKIIKESPSDPKELIKRIIEYSARDEIRDDISITVIKYE